ncbi:TPA: trimethoprim-resistant dihydrofolate reductase DfrA8 [Escherichia coli]|nr:trimethoprim-resistant dihydrofolate reductase DfrA8 [Escherichia coli]
MIELHAILAATANGCIGKDNALPWPPLKGDLARFKKLTMGKVGIMGRKTYESLPVKLEGRTCIVMTRQALELPGVRDANGAIFVNNVSDAMRFAQEESVGDVAYVIGGAEIFKRLALMITQIELTFVKRLYEGDTYVDLAEMVKDYEQNGMEEHDLHTYFTYRKKELTE